MQVLPDRAAHGTGNADVVLEPRPTARDGFLDQILDDGAALGPKETVVAVFAKIVVSGGIADDQTAESPIANENVGTQPENEVRYVEVARREHGIRKRVGGSCLEKQIGWSADSKCRVWRDWLILAHVARVEPRGEAVEL